MNLLYPQVLWLFIPLVVFAYFLRPLRLTQATHLVILSLLLITLSRPQFKEGLTEEPIEARDILIALDISYSMRAQDLAPNRYEYAKVTIEALLKKDTRDNIMLIAFTTNPLLLSPPTTDHRLIHTALEALDLNHILTKGTSLVHLFDKIAQMKKVHREIILMTDGGEENDLKSLIESLHTSDSRLTILALGTEHGATVPDDEGMPLKDKSGHLVVSRLNPLLEQLAKASKGSYLLPSVTPEESAGAIMTHLNNAAEETHLLTKQRYATTELYWLPLLLAAILFLMLHTRAARYLLIGYALLGVHLNASFLEIMQLKNAYESYREEDYNRSAALLQKIEAPSLQTQYALANSYYKQKAYKKALRIYQSIRSTSPHIKQRLYYNIANTYAMMGKYDKAKIYYTKTLQLGEDADALYNLSLLMQHKERQQNTHSISLPKSQEESNAAKNSGENLEKKDSNSNKQQSSGSGAGGSQQKSNQENEKKGRLKLDESARPQPLGSKVYELINKGYIRETKPW